jgi:hypothetical protein
MEDMVAHLETLRVQIAECEMIRDLATDPVKRELFRKLAEHYKVLPTRCSGPLPNNRLAALSSR